MNDLYEVLGVAKNATQSDIKKAFKSLAQKHHPDRNNGDQTIFQQVKEAYDVLGDQERRDHYDATGQTDKPDMDKEVENRAMLLFKELLQDGKFCGDFIEVAKNQIYGALEDLVQSRDNIDTKYTSLLAFSGRVDCRNEENVFEIILEDELQLCRNRLQHIHFEDTVMRQLLDLMDAYRDKSPTRVTGKQWNNDL